MSYLWYWPSGGWDFDAWKAKADWQPIFSQQSGKSELLPLLHRRAGLREWETGRDDWLRITRAILGEVNDLPVAPVRWHVIEQAPTSLYQRLRLQYSLTSEEWGYGWLLLPSGVREPRPAVIALHQTVPQGKDEPVGLEGDPELAYGKELAERGFVVFAPDAIGFGERRKDHPNAFYHTAEQFFNAHPNGSAMAKMVYDLQRAVDLLQQLPEVDGNRIGCIGHSHGGYGTLFGMIFEPRIKTGVISCGVTVLRSDPTPHRWWRMTALMPRLGFYEGQIEQTPVDFHHWLALVAPRPLMVVAALNDSIFPNTDNIPNVLGMVRKVYKLYGAEANLQRWVFHGAHRFPRAARARAYRLLFQL